MNCTKLVTMSSFLTAAGALKQGDFGGKAVYLITIIPCYF